MTQCSVKNCTRTADYKAILYDVYIPEEEVFFEQDYTCQFLCASHMAENERQARGVREPRGYVQYPYTNQQVAQRFTIYQPLDA